jgi:predicted  nucleic acid-binding Zn-ribbon protein
MITDIDVNIKTQLINNRLQNLSRQHFEAELDKVQADANGQADNVARVTERMTELENAYIAIEALLGPVV